MHWLEPIGARLVPGNFGPLRGFNAHARIEGDCGDTVEAWLRLEGNRILEASFTSDGCGTSVACASAAAHLARGRTLAEMRALNALHVLEALGIADQEAGAEAHHCASLALSTLVKALAEYESGS